jgi:ribosome-associated toxin RatA of RatAB toxin-antitoxin module
VIHTSNTIEIAAPAATIYALAAATERWPLILPQYRRVRVLEEHEHGRLVEMAAWRDVIPIRWVAEQVNDPGRPHIAFRHVAGWTTGMQVEWLFDPIPGGTRVRIEHGLDFKFPFASRWLGKHVVCDFFVRDVAGKTLAQMKRLAEGQVPA